MPDAHAAADFDPLLTVHLKTLSSDVRDWLLDRLKHDHSALPWNVRPEADQQRTIDQADAKAAELVEHVVQLVMSQGRPAIVARLKQVKRKGGTIAGEVQFPASDQLRHAFNDAEGQDVLIVLSPEDVNSSSRAKPNAKADQGDMFGTDDDGGDDGPDDGPVFDNTDAGGGKK